MKSNKIISLLLLVLFPICGKAQGVDYKYIVDKSLWFNTSNASGLSIMPLEKYNILDIGYSVENGSYHLYPQGRGTNGVDVSTQGALQIDKFYLWGRFSYGNKSARNASYNTLLFNPLDERMLYGVADTVLSKWKKQSYDMEFKAAYPAIEDKLFVGLHLAYTDNIGAKQVDPRTESSRYSISVKPSLSYFFANNENSDNTLGLSLLYSNSFERSVPVLSNSSNPQKVYILKGLGNYVDEIVGSGGLRTMYYKTDTYGAHIQYGLNSKSVQKRGVVAEVGVEYHTTKAKQNPTQPQLMGKSAMTDYFANLQCYLEPLGESSNSLYKLDLSYLKRDTKGTEYTLVFDAAQGSWNVMSEAVMNKFSTNIASLRLKKYQLNSKGNERNLFLHRYNYLLSIEWFNKDDKYILPLSTLKYNNLFFKGEVEKYFGNLTVGLGIGYNYNLYSEYLYGGIHPNSAPAKKWYPHDADILTSNWLSSNLAVAYNFKIYKDLILGLKGNLEYLSTLESNNKKRYGFSLTASFLF